MRDLVASHVLASSDGYLRFVVHAPGLEGDEVRTEKQAVERSRLGLGAG